MHISTIFFLEKKLLIRDKWILVALFLFTLTALWSLHNGQQVYHYHATAADSLQAANNANFANVKAELDTLDFSHNGRAAVETPFTLDYRLKPMVSRELNPMMAFSIGQNDVLVLHKSARITQPVFSNDFDDFKNPEQLLAGSFDLSFYLLFLFPLLFLALSYNLQSAEKEKGIWINWQAAASKGLLAAHTWRITIRWVLSLAPFIIVSIVGLIWLSDQYNFMIVDWLKWQGYALLYCLLWLIIVWLIHRLRLNSMLNGITILGVWILLLIAIPGVVNTLSNSSYADSSQIDIANFRDIPEASWEAPFEVHKNYFAKRYNKPLKDTGLYSETIVKVYGYMMMTLEAEEVLHNNMTEALLNRKQMEKVTFLINPAAAIFRGFTQVAQSGQAHQIAFEQKLYAYRLQRFYHMNDNLVNAYRFKPDDLLAMPEWNPNEE